MTQRCRAAHVLSLSLRLVCTGGDSGHSLTTDLSWGGKCSRMATAWVVGWKRAVLSTGLSFPIPHSVGRLTGALVLVHTTLQIMSSVSCCCQFGESAHCTSNTDAIFPKRSLQTSYDMSSTLCQFFNPSFIVV